MNDFFAALGLVLVIEGVLLAAAPTRLRDALLQLSEQPQHRLQILGLVSATIGVGVVALVRL